MGRNRYEDKRPTELPPTPQSVEGADIANTINVDVIGGVPILFRIDIADGVSANIDVAMTHKIRIIDVWLVKISAAGGASDTIRVDNVTTAITDAMDINVADKIIVKAATIDDANHEISAGDNLRVAMTKVSVANTACIVYVLALRVA